MCSIPIFSWGVLTSSFSHESLLHFNVSKSFNKMTRSTLIYEAKLTSQHALCIVIQSECRKVTSERQTRPYFFTIHESFFLAILSNSSGISCLLCDSQLIVPSSLLTSRFFSACHLELNYKQRVMGCIFKWISLS